MEVEVLELKKMLKNNEVVLLDVGNPMRLKFVMSREAYLFL